MNIWLMKTIKSWAGMFLTSQPCFVGIDEEGIDTHYGNLSPDQRNNLFAQLQQTSTASSQFGLIKRFFDDFYDLMAPGDIVVLGVGQRTQFNAMAILRVEGEALFSGGRPAPFHTREVNTIWTGVPFPAPKWGYARRLEKLETLDKYQEFIGIYISLTVNNGGF